MAVPGDGTLYATVPFYAELITINPNNGDFVLVGQTFHPVDLLVPIPSLAMDSQAGIMYGGGGSEFFNLYTVDTSSGDLTLVGPTGQGNLVGLDFSPGGELFAAVKPEGTSSGGTHLGTVDKNTGDTTIIGPFGVPRMGAIAFASDGTLYGATENNGQQLGELYTIDTDTGQANLVAPIQFANLPTNGGFASIQFGCNGSLYGGAGSTFDDFGIINTLTGSFDILATQVDFTIGGMAFESRCSIPVGGQLIPIGTTALLLAGAQSPTGIMLTILLISFGIGAYFVIVQNRRRWNK